MYLTLSKLEFKRGFLYYLILYLFFFFWSLSSFSGYFIFTNFNQLLENFQTDQKLLILFFKNNDTNINNDFFNDLLSILKTEAFEKVTEEELLKELDLYDDLHQFLNEDLRKYLPIGIRVSLNDWSKLPEIKKNISLIEMKYKITPYIAFEEFYNKLSKFKSLRFLLIFLLILWNLFYFLFFYFINKSLNKYLQIYIDTFQLLGGELSKLIIVRLLLIIPPFFLLYLSAFYIYMILSNFFVLTFPLLNYFPDTKSSIELIYFFIYSLFICILYPFFIVYISFRKL